MSFASPLEPPLLIGIDIGGTKTQLRAIADGDEQRDLIVSSSSWRRRDWDEDAEGLLALVGQLAGEAAVAAIGIGAHGCDDAEECKALETAVAARTSAKVAVVNDAELMPLALGFPGQIGVVAGTGSIAVCRPSPDRMLVAGGWGWIVGDEGSAAALVRQAVRAVALHFDRGGDASEPLAAAILASLEVKAIPRLGSTLGQLRSAAEVGVHAVAVFTAAEQGSHLAQAVIREGGRMLADLAALLDARGAGASHVVAGGSVIVEQPSLWAAFVAGLGETAAHLTPHLFTGKPVEGACALARLQG
ncbi:MAG TPA: BadF/BadG/BcrA/BcrD ATPase family protein [Devosia sp.]|jgi:N-acetylglucosamine kinase-like BadF-type ATPase|uniref:N-acetylglucosamine kinase n=1 Tax=Devosia sp. TaxID=1871048 RepID=UPI002DDD6EB6|nr:BadF/BadG/BcrA/BcrD ATPase family protein [Devosia sp.]HEV2517347.1 BadF/BadG/BcrA/BcrD ATPase family protein [Devosia sp.]